jgi:small subunit ribosomal protein S6
MRAYELMVIIDGDVDDPKAQSWIKSVTDGIEAAGGTIHGRPDWWGKRQFAYPINRKETGSTSSSAPCASRTMSSATS